MIDPRPLALSVGRACRNRKELGSDVGVEDERPFRIRDRLDRADPHHPGDVHQNVEPVEPAHGLFRRVADARVAAHVDGEERGLAACRGAEPRRFRAAFLVQVGDHDRRAFFREALGDRSADAGRGADEQRTAPSQAGGTGSGSCRRIPCAISQVGGGGIPFGPGTLFQILSVRLKAQLTRGSSSAGSIARPSSERSPVSARPNSFACSSIEAAICSKLLGT